MIKTFFRWLLRTLYGFQAYNESVLQTPGPILLIPNHTSWLDWLFLVVCLERDWKFVVSQNSAETSWLHRKIMLNPRTFPIDTLSPYAVKRMAEHLQGNGRLVLFAEGRISRTGCLMKLFDGTGFLLHKTGAKVITCYLRGAHRLPLSPNRDRKRWFPKVSAHFSQVLMPPKLENVSTFKSRTKLTAWLRDHMVLQRFETEFAFSPATLPASLVDSARARRGSRALADIKGEITYRRLLAASFVLGQEIQRRLPADSSRIGVLLPNVNAAPVTLLGLWFIGKVPALLNYSTGIGTLLACVQLAGIKQIITSRSFLERARLNLQPLSDAGVELLYLEEIGVQISPARKLTGLLRAQLSPRSCIRNLRTLPEDTAAILFTSGSEGAPKGVELTHANILANIHQMLSVCDLQDWDRFFNSLPLFHSFGLTIGTILPLVRGCHVMLYPSPLHYRVVPTAFYYRDCTIMLGTNTFLNGYARKAHPQDWRSLRYMFAGAEKLQESTASCWAQRFGVRVLEGYGATECGPCVSVNTPLAPKHGSAGKLLPGISYRLQPVEGVEDGGRLFVKGQNIMRGYLNPEPNKAFRNLGGWYDTGDIAAVDEEGFVHLKGRLKRFAKVSGEMVSLTAVEEALSGAFPHYGLRCQVAVLSRPDTHKGEILIAVSNEQKMQLDELRGVLRAKGFPNIFAPRELKFLRNIPKLGSGKVDYRELEKLV